ncbi:LodA/GoxA family CTQ-dependent oxidase [Polyangium sp. y55x31]|uniref:LodA/GoxA family CTQ-dependent oxidase n=1 Tax=Polyangium sp. y55x31 TaxID=3042688 RepID=UPI0024829DD1|nr:LodA/GoxA family CTQ-dependent oxidase [Polyangium sp. y55x31]MDI1481971.1 LodA/GoxA family CTQ-dependent oxidase [Polyangium sp. y55x31]
MRGIPEGFVVGGTLEAGTLGVNGSQDELYQIDAAANPTRRGFLAGSMGMIAAVFGRRALAAGGGGTPVYRIHPAIGIARVGNADPDTFFIGPEVPGLPPLGSPPGTSAPPYKVNGKIKPQAARFRIYEYQSINGRLTPVREVNLDTPGVVGIKWTTHLANKKASFHRFQGPAGESTPPGALRNAAVQNRRSLEIDFGPRTIGGSSQGPSEFRVGSSSNPAAEAYPIGANGQPVIDYLGQLRTDAEGRLIVIGGQGRANYSTPAKPELVSYANNDNWFDDVSDGPVTAVVTIDDGNGGTIDVPVDEAGGAWVIVGPPDFAPGVFSAVTLYDVLYDLAVRQLPIPEDNALYTNGGELARLTILASQFDPLGPVEFPSYRPDYDKEIRPIFERGFEYRWVTALVNNSKHDSLVSPTLSDPSPKFAKTRSTFFQSMRPALGAQAPSGTGSMPRMLGDDPYNPQSAEAVYRLAVTRTQYGLLRNWCQGKFASGPPASQAVVITPHGLDRASLEAVSGGAFFPGMEVSWQIRNAALYIEPFRLDLNAMSQYVGENQKIGPGHFTRQMALPWQADFNECANEGQYAWWPATRPDDVYPTASATKKVPWARPTDRFAGGNRESTKADMAEHWYKFGFVVEQGGAQIETERSQQIP